MPQKPKIGVSDLGALRVSGDDRIVTKGGDGFSSLWVLLTVGVDGRVIDAKVSDNFGKLDPGPALAAARKWTFKPQSFDGHPVEIVGSIEIHYEAPEIPADPAVPFPNAAPSDIEITLERGACYGTCPDYRVSVTGDGKVRFSNREDRFSDTAASVHLAFEGRNVLWPGVHEDRVDPKIVARLIEKFRAAHFFGLKPKYIAGITDSSSQALEVRVGGKTHRVVDYVGRMVGMPKVVEDLEDAVDDATGTERWVYGNLQTIDLLKRQNFDFHSKAAGQLVRAILYRNTQDKERKRASTLLRALLAEGVDLDISVREAGGAPVGVLLARYAVEGGDVSLFEDMQRRGYVKRMDQETLDKLLTGDMGCSSVIARGLVEAGANPRAKTDNGTALHAIQKGYGECAKAPVSARVEMARTLISLGVPLDGRDRIGWTPLMTTDTPAIADLLIKAGADINAKTEDGTTPLLNAYDDRIAIALLRKGADPRAKGESETVRQHAERHHLPATLAWLDAHGIQ